MKENENKIESTINQHCTVGPLFSKKLKNCEIKWEIVSNFVAFLENLNFIRIPSVQQTRAMAVMFFCDASHEISAKIMVKTRLSHLAAIGLFGLKIVKRQKVFCQIASGLCKVICFNAI